MRSKRAFSRIAKTSIILMLIFNLNLQVSQGLQNQKSPPKFMDIFYPHKIFSKAIKTSVMLLTRACPSFEVHWQMLKMLRAPWLYPELAFNKPLTTETLYESRTAENVRKEFCGAFTNDELADIVRSSNRINFLYGYMFDEGKVDEDLLTQILGIDGLGCAARSNIRWRMIG